MTQLDTYKRGLDIKQAGMVSILVTVILMFVISITVLGFAQVIRKSQRQALDHQLSSQAFYAAETGINDARKIISQTPGATIQPKTECGPQAPYNLSGDIDSTTGTRYTCLLITGSPKALSYDLSTTASSKVFPINSDGGAIQTIDIEWRSPPGSATPSAGCESSVSASLPRTDAWNCGYGMIRIDLVPVNTLERAMLMQNNFTAFLTPITGGPSNPTVSYRGSGLNVHGGLANQGARPGAKCDDTSCKISISNLGGTRYYARVSTLYENSTLNLVAKDNNGTALSLSGAQILIDSTGKAQDVLRRIQVRLPLVSDGLHPDYGLQTTDSICKQFTTYPGYLNASPC